MSSRPFTDQLIYANSRKKVNTNAVLEQRVPSNPLYTSITAGRPWPVGNSGKKKSATLLILPLCIFS